MDATIPCEQCGQAAPRETFTYSTAGELLCRACTASGVIAKNDARAATSKRNVRIAAVVIVALVVGVPTLMIAAGAGQYVSYGLMGIGAVLLVGGRSARRMGGTPSVARGAVFVMLAGVAAIGLGIVLGGALHK